MAPMLPPYKRNHPLLTKFFGPASTLLAAAMLIAVNGCGPKNSDNSKAVKTIPNGEWKVVGGKAIMLDFESPDPGVKWQPSGSLPQNGPSTEPSAPSPAPPTPTETSQLNEALTPAHTPAEETLTRSSVRPRDGLWSLKINLQPNHNGDIEHSFTRTRDLRNFDTLTAGIMHTDAPGRPGEWAARLFIVDETGKKVVGDPIPITVRWQDLLLDLATAEEEGLDLEHVVKVGVSFSNVRPKEGEEPLDVQTDTWTASRDHKDYQGQRAARNKNFYAERDGTRLHVGVAGQYEITFHQRSGVVRPWISITSSLGETVLGQTGTGLMLLDQNGFDALGTAVHQDAFKAAAETATELPRVSWPIRPIKEGADNDSAQAHLQSTWRWECVWTSPVAAIVELKQEVGPYDRLGEPAGRLAWRFMIYQWGQVFVHVDWTGTKESVGRPITWALITEEGAGGGKAGVQAKVGDATGAAAERLLSAIYPVAIKEGLRTALPHQMQTAAPVAMVAKGDRTGPGAKNLWWWAHGEHKRVFGSGLSTTPGVSSADCMLLVNEPDALMQAASFGSYLAPPKVRVRQGELDRNFPGDVDNDGLVDSYGFQVVRLSAGRASFMIYPQERPLFYPPYLFTVPAIEREAVDLEHSRVLINLDGKQFADPPRFPDGSFLLQLPYVIDRPVAVEAILVKK